MCCWSMCPNQQSAVLPIQPVYEPDIPVGWCFQALLASHVAIAGSPIQPLSVHPTFNFGFVTAEGQSQKGFRN